MPLENKKIRCFRKVVRDSQNCVLIIGRVVCYFRVQVGPMLRWRIRQHRHLHGSMLSDVVVHCFCPFCALIQENRELYGYVGAHVGEQLPLHVEITRQ